MPYNCTIRLMDVKQGQNKEGKTVLYLVFEYMDTDVKKFIRTFRAKGETMPLKIVKVCSLNDRSCMLLLTHLLLCLINLCSLKQSLMYQLCKGVAFCHGHGVLHR